MERWKLDGSPLRPPIVVLTGFARSASAAVRDQPTQYPALSRTLTLLDGFREMPQWPGLARVGCG